MVNPWSLLISPEASAPTETEIVSDSVLLDAPTTFFLNPALHALINTKENEPLWTPTWPGGPQTWKKFAQELELNVIAHQTRHSGPPIDITQGLRTIEAEKKHGAMSFGQVSHQIRTSRPSRLCEEKKRILFTARASVFTSKGFGCLQRPVPRGDLRRLRPRDEQNLTARSTRH